MIQHSVYKLNKALAAKPLQPTEAQPVVGEKPSDKRFDGPPAPIPSVETKTSRDRSPVKPLPTSNANENVTPMGIGMGVVGVQVTNTMKDAPGTVGVSPAGVGVTGSR